MSVTHKLLGAIAVIVALALPANILVSNGQNRVLAPEVGGARYRVIATEADRDGARRLSSAVEDSTFRFVPGTPEVSRQAVLRAVADASPAARRLIGLVDGLVVVRVGPTGAAGAIGLTTMRDPGYDVVVDLGPVSQRYGQRGIDRVVLHELGHVIDHAIVPAALDRQLGAGIPAGYGCDQGSSGACASADERFAESFAKWAVGDIGLDLTLGYKVMPPEPSLSAWGAPLQRLG
ncbi:MAG: hypothetical protein ABI950_08610 [Solirubrobacteraceae bacterium]